MKSHNPQEYWRLLNKDKKSKQSLGNISVDTFKDHFQNLGIQIDREDESELDCIIDTGTLNNEVINNEFSLDEVTTHIKLLKNNKSSGIDDILNEYLKHCPIELMSVIVKLFNIILNSAIIPTAWTIGIIKPIYKKKGDINNVENYRGITLLSCIGKLFTSLINTRLHKYLEQEKLLGEEQAGFRRNYSTLDHIFTLHILTNYYISHKKTIILFVSRLQEGL